MEVVPHQAIRKHICDGMYVLDVQFKKIAIVTFFAEQLLAIVTAIVDMIEQARLEWCSCVLQLSLSTSLPDLTGLRDL
jgi:hypothetical protein